MNDEQMTLELQRLFDLARDAEAGEKKGPTARDLTKVWGLSRAQVQTILYGWAEQGWVVGKPYRFRSLLTGELRKSYYYVLTEEGKQFLTRDKEGD